MREFFYRLSIASFDGKQQMGEVVLVLSYNLRKMTYSESYPYTQDSQDILDSKNSNPDFINPIFTGDESWMYGNTSFSLQWKSDESTEHYFSQMLPVINGR